MNPLEKKVDDRRVKIWTKFSDVNATINLQFYMQYELQNLELTA